jgi:hypothetical protein
MNEESFIESFVDEFKSAMKDLEEASPISADMIMKTDYANYVRSRMERAIDPPRLAPMTATEVHLRREAEFARMDRAQKEAEAVKLTPSVEHPPIDIVSIGSVHRLLCKRNLDPKTLSLVIPEGDFLSIYADHAGAAVAAASSMMRLFDIEILRGTPEMPELGVYINNWSMVPADWDALRMEILRCLGRGGVSELPQSASSNGVSPSVKTAGEVGVTPGAASGDNGNPDRFAHLSDEAKIIAAKAAIAAYGREKKLPSASHLALFRELDSLPPKHKRGEIRQPGLYRMLTGGFPGDIDRHDHSLSSESLGRACDQMRVGEGSGSYRDLVSAAPQRLAEMVYRGDSAANGKRGE